MKNKVMLIRVRGMNVLMALCLALLMGLINVNFVQPRCFADEERYKFARLKLINIESGKTENIKSAIKKKIKVEGTSFIPYVCLSEQNHKKVIYDSRALIKVDRDIDGQNISFGWVSKRYFNGFVAGRHLVLLDGCE